MPVVGMRLEVHCTNGARVGFSFFSPCVPGGGWQPVYFKTRPTPDVQLRGLWRTGSAMADFAGGWQQATLAGVARRTKGSRIAGC